MGIIRRHLARIGRTTLEADSLPELKQALEQLPRKPHTVSVTVRAAGGSPEMRFQLLRTARHMCADCGRVWRAGPRESKRYLTMLEATAGFKDIFDSRRCPECRKPRETNNEENPIL